MKKLILLLVCFLPIFLFAEPVHAVSNVINGPDTVYKQSSSIVTINDVLLLYSSDGRFVTAAEDNFTGNGATVGTYQVKLAASDGISEIYRFIQINVIQTIGNITLVGDGNIYIRPDQTLDFTQIRTVLRNVGYIQIPVGTGYQILQDEYSGNEAEVGVYDYQFRLISASGHIQNVSIKIYVSDDFTQFNNDDIIPADPGPLTSMWNGISKFIIDILIWGGLILVGYWFFVKRKKKGYGRSL